jgi:hypothetical protein
MISRRTNLRKVFAVHAQIEQTRDTLSAMDQRDPRLGPLLDMYTELLALRAKVERAERRRP